MRLLYTLLLTLLTPLIVLRLWLKGRQLPAYRQRIAERFAHVPRQPVAVWVHAVSVGEALAAVPMIKALIAQHGERQVWVTTTTPTGSERVQAALGASVVHSYAPYDLPWIVRRFLARAQPKQVVIMETELWPNLFAALKARGIPLTIANARLSPRSFKGYGRVGGFARSVLSAVSTVAAQSPLDAQRFAALGAPNVLTVGNIKFDFPLPTAQLQAGQALRQQLGWAVPLAVPVWAAVSTHEGEEAAALAAHALLCKTLPEARLILVPRHPQRFEAVAALIQKTGLRWQRRSDVAATAHNPSPQILLGNSMGEMFTYLAAADAVFVGGSLVPVGGHNVLEPAALALPVLFGPQMHNFLAARDLLLAADAAQQVADAAALAEALRELFQHPARAQAMGQAGATAVAANQGALARLLALL